MNELKIKGKIFVNESIVTKTGMEIFSGSLMLSRKDKKTDQWLNSFVPVEAFGTSALEFKKLTNKSTIIITGKLGADEYTDKKDGSKKTSIYIMAFSYEFMSEPFKADPKAVEDVKAYKLEENLNIIDDIPF